MPSLPCVDGRIVRGVGNVCSLYSWLAQAHADLTSWTMESREYMRICDFYSNRHGYQLLSIPLLITSVHLFLVRFISNTDSCVGLVSEAPSPGKATPTSSSYYQIHQTLYDNDGQVPRCSCMQY